MQGDLISRDFSVKALREYAEQKHTGGETELANGILKAINFLQKEENVPTVYSVEKVVADLKEIEIPKPNDLGEYVGGYLDYENTIKIVLNGGKE